MKSLVLYLIVVSCAEVLSQRCKKEHVEITYLKSTVQKLNNEVTTLKEDEGTCQDPKMTNNKNQIRINVCMPTSVSADVGTTVRFRCSAGDTLEDVETVAWRKEEGEVPQHRATQVNENMLIIKNLSVSDSGKYVCEARSEEATISHEILLSVTDLKEQCPADSFTCLDGMCIESMYRCDDIQDCPDGSDEENCDLNKTDECFENQFKCGDGPCIDRTFHCDGFADCLDSTDEKDCNSECSSEQFTCSDGTCIEMSQVCDGEKDCEDEQDELSCTKTAGSCWSATRTGIAPHGTTVFMECPLRSQDVTWSRYRAPLPKQSSVKDGKLKIPNLKEEDTGVYLCKHKESNMYAMFAVNEIVSRFTQEPSSYIALPTIPRALHSFEIQVYFKPESENGLILYNGQGRRGAGDFLSLGLNESYVEFRFNLGSGPIVIRSTEQLEIGEWHTVRLFRNMTKGTMYVDSEGPFTGEVTGRLQSLDLRQPLYVGGVADYRHISKLSGLKEGFKGCISRLVIGSVPQNLVTDALLRYGVTACDTCAVNPCLGSGVCQEASAPQGYRCLCPPGLSGVNCERAIEVCFPGVCGDEARCMNRADGYRCLCPYGKQGPQCQEDVEIEDLSFSDGAYIAFPTPTTTQRFTLNFEVKPLDESDGVLAYCAEKESGKGHFTSLAIKDRRFQFTFDSGAGPKVIRGERDVTPGEWTKVSLTHGYGREELKDDNSDIEQMSEEEETKAFKLKTLLYIGGYNTQHIQLPQKVGVTQGFSGCIRKIRVSGAELDVPRSLLDSANVKNCSDK